MTMRYILSVFVGNRFGIFNYSTKQLGGYVDIDWFSTEKIFTEDRFYGEGVLNSFSIEDLTIASLEAKTEYTVVPGTSTNIEMKAKFQSGNTSNVASQCVYQVENPNVLNIVGGKLIGQTEGSTNVTATYTDVLGNQQTVEFKVTVAIFPLIEGALNPSIYGKGTFKQSTASLTTEKDGFGGWEYSDGIDISQYDKLVIKLRRAPTNKPHFRLYDDNDFKSRAYYDYDIGTKKTVEIPLKDLVKVDGNPLDLTHICIAGFLTQGVTALYISDIHLEKELSYDVNADGVVDISDVVAIINQMAGTMQYPKADVNNDNAVDISDVVAVINAMAGQSEE